MNLFHLKFEKLFLVILFIFYIIAPIILINNTTLFKYSYLVIFFNFLILLLFQKNKFNNKALFIFIFLYFIFLSIEIIGVKTGKIFGQYYYGNSLGPKFLEVPLTIGLNWIFLTYMTYSIVNIFKMNDYLKIILASCLMIFYDVILEEIAAFMGLWYWVNNTVPLLNYVSWFLISLSAHLFLTLFKVEIKNNMSFFVYFFQIIFFVIIKIISKV